MTARRIPPLRGAGTVRPQSLLLALLLAVATPLASAQPAAPPGAETERLVFRLMWGPLPVGQAVLEARPHARTDPAAAPVLLDNAAVSGEAPGQDRLFRLTARSNFLADLFVKVRDHLEGTCDAEFRRSFRYAKDLREGRQARNFTVAFDWERFLATRTSQGRVEWETGLGPSVLDPLSVFHAFRSAPLAPGQRREAVVSDGIVTATASVDILRAEPVRMGNATVPGLAAEVRMPGIDGVFRIRDNTALKIWITDGPERIPVRLECQALVGGFVGRFTGVLLRRETGPDAQVRP